MTNTTETQNLCGLKRENFQTTVNGKKTDLYILRNAAGYEVAVTNLGGQIEAVMVPDKNGNVANVIMGNDNIQSALSFKEASLSTIIGRYANRIAGGRFQLHGKEYDLPINNGPNTLHGGKEGFNHKVWDAHQVSPQAVVMKYTSPYGEEGFTGEVQVMVAFTFTDDNELVIKYMATANKQTIINLTHHGYFALRGIADPTPTVENMELQLNADYYLLIDNTSIPTGEIRLVKDTPFDFRTAKPIGKDIDADNEQLKNGSGYDHCFVLNKKEEGEYALAAKLRDPESGRTMEMYTTEPGVQLYTANFLDGYKGTNGATYQRRSAVCLEAQHFPDTPNHPYFPSVVLKPGMEYRQKTVYKFGVE